jgi:hypothetical protein
VTVIRDKLVSEKKSRVENFEKHFGKEMLMELILLTIGIVIGAALSFIFQNRKAVGVLRIDKSDSDGPYIFLELKKGVNDIAAEKTVLLEVKREDFIPRD